LGVRAIRDLDSRQRRPQALRLANGATLTFPAVMGVLNVTPDSFSDGGQFLDPDLAVERALEMAREGADVIDIGGESTRPGALEVPAEEESERVLAVLRKLKPMIECPISVDTRKAIVAERALAAGAAIINDVSAMTFDPEMAAVVARYRAAAVLMHMRGTPATMQRMARYHDVVKEVCSYLLGRARAAQSAGIAKSRIILDPGIGFAKKRSHNLILLAGLSRLCRLGYPVLVGVSRKHFIRQIAGERQEQLLLGTAAAVSVAIVAAVKVARAIGAAGTRSMLNR
jgi:dihydropteroate synthase